MKIATCQIGDSSVAAVVQKSDVVPVRGTASVADLVGLAAGEISAQLDDDRVPLSSVHLSAPIPNPVRNVFCTGWNYLAHFDEGRERRAPDRELPEAPTFFTKATTTLSGPTDNVSAHAALTTRLDWEAELAVVIGAGGRDIAIEDALDHVFGYTVANDVSARDLQRAHGGQWFKGKSLDGTCPTGPWVVTPDELPDPQGLDVGCSVNDVVVQTSSTSRMIFPVARLISELSQGLTLLAGDVLLTGTPEGVGNSREPPQYLSAGDLLTTTISGIGTIRNRIS